jgi:leucine dehydrogenase
MLDAGTIEQLNCKIVAGGANNQLAGPEDATLLLSRKILYAPDYVINAGAAIAIPGMELSGWSREEAEKSVVKSIKGALQQVFELAEQQGITTETAARIIAEKRLAA